MYLFSEGKLHSPLVLEHDNLHYPLCHNTCLLQLKAPVNFSQSYSVAKFGLQGSYLLSQCYGMSFESQRWEYAQTSHFQSSGHSANRFLLKMAPGFSNVGVPWYIMWNPFPKQGYYADFRLLDRLQVSESCEAFQELGLPVSVLTEFSGILFFTLPSAKGRFPLPWLWS
jgi:hypothetical protein